MASPHPLSRRRQHRAEQQSPRARAAKLVLEKKNWLFVGHDLGGKRTAAILTLVATCVTHDVNPRAYLHLVTKLVLSGWPQKNLRDLLPDRLAVSHPEVLLRAQDAVVRGTLPD